MQSLKILLISLLFLLQVKAHATFISKKHVAQDSAVLLTDTAKPKVYYGMASFYSKSLDGTKTTSGETFSQKKFTCASNRFKLNTWLRVTNISNGKSIIVRVNDRMHPRMDKKGRIVDLSIAGASKLGFIAKGVTKVKVEPVPKGTKE